MDEKDNRRTRQGTLKYIIFGVCAIFFSLYILSLSIPSTPVEVTEGGRRLKRVPDTARKIVQIGDSRSASTFQWYVLCSIMRLRHPEETVGCDDSGITRNTRIQVYKSHDPRDYDRLKGVEGTYFFGSVKGTNRTEVDSYADDLTKFMYFQVYEDFVQRGLASLWDYQDIFSLSDSQMQVLHQHIRYWEIIRRCCGKQQSFDSRLALHNSTLPRLHKFLDFDYPGCEIYDMDAVERNFLRTHLSKRYKDQLYSASYVKEDIIRKGFCSKSIEYFKSGADIASGNWNNSVRCTSANAKGRFVMTVGPRGKKTLVFKNGVREGCF